MKCVTTFKNGQFVKVEKVADGISAKGSCVDTIREDGYVVFKEGLDGNYFCPRVIYKDKVRDFGKTKEGAAKIAEQNATKEIRAKAPKAKTTAKERRAAAPKRAAKESK